jgi:[acyl-carrier-protein] S-malonyltransferase
MGVKYFRINLYAPLYYIEFFQFVKGDNILMEQINNKNILVFPGQGSQYVGMSRDLAEKFTACEKIYECGSDILGYDLKDLINNSDDVKLTNTEFAQPAIFTASLIALQAARESGIAADFHAAAGHSLGEYAALVCCGVLDAENGFKAIKARSRIMAKAGQANPGGMTAVIGATAEQILETIGDSAVIANYNSPVQIVIAGTLDGLDKAEELLGKADIRRLKTVRLKTSAAFHTELMREAADEFLAEARKLTFNPAKADFYSNVYAGKAESVTAEYLHSHMISPVNFTQESEQIRQDGYDTFIEIGPGKVLSGLIKKSMEGVRVFNIEDIESLSRVGGEL